MANIKEITIQLDGDTTKLTEALKNVNKEIRVTQSDLRELNKLLKIDPGNTDLYRFFQFSDFFSVRV